MDFKNISGFLKNHLASSRLVRDRRGSVAVLVALAIIPLIGFIGIGTDTARAVMVKSRLSSAVDAAGLAGGKSYFSDDRDAEIQMFFDANFPAGYMNADVGTLKIVPNDAEEKLELSVTATVPTTFMKLFGFESIDVAASAEITRQVKMLDVVLAIDMSGSMDSSTSSGDTRIEAARAAANDLVTILFGDDASKDLLQIGLVPWSAKVNVMVDGESYDSGETTEETVSSFTNPVTGATQNTIYYANNSPVPLLSEPPADWEGCVYNRFIDDASDDNDADVLYGPVSTLLADWPAWEPVGEEGEPVSGWNVCSLSVSGSECQSCLNHGITPLQHTKQTIEDAINALLSPGGTTNISQGLGWAWRVLMPESPFTEADPDPEYKREQAIVLLTDGQNYGGEGDGYKGTFGTGNTARTEMDGRLKTLAGNIKADGVVIYVIQFANDGTALQELLQGVASGPDTPYYYYAPDADTLKEAFHEIANNLSELRLSK